MKPVVAVLAPLFLSISVETAHAQSTDPRHVAALEQCVAAYAKGAPPERVIGGCVGIIGAQCSGQTTIEIANCIMAEYQAWDLLLNRWWGPMRARAKANGTWNTLLDSQRKWIAYKEAECARAYDSAGGGSIRVIYGAECQRDLTARKAVEFFYALGL